MKFIFTSFSKKRFYLRHQVSAFVLKNKHVPINPYMNWDYNLSGLVPKNYIRIANNTLIHKCDELWVFGEVSDGLLVEIFLAKKRGIPVRFFSFNEDIKQIKEHPVSAVQLEDVSPWIWEWVMSGKDLSRWHPRLRLRKTYPLIYPAYSKRNFFWHMHISKFCIEHHTVPLNPFMLFKYFLGDGAPRESIYQANAEIVKRAEQLWTFGEIADGVLKEIDIAKKAGKMIRHYKIISSNSVNFRKISEKSLEFEQEALHLLSKQNSYQGRENNT